MENQNIRTEMLIGSDGLEKLKKSRVAIFGVGGVGGYAVEALARAGVSVDRIVSQAMSDSMPMYQEVMPEGERLNRRAEIYLTY